MPRKEYEAPGPTLSICFITGAHFILGFQESTNVDVVGMLALISPKFVGCTQKAGLHAG